MPVSPPTPSPSVDNEAHLTLDYLLRRMRFKSDFPALATSITRIQALCGSESESLHTLCDEILKDVALTQKLLRVVNTAHYRRASTDPISTVSRAVSLIGLAGVRNLALSLMLLEHMEDKVHAQQLKVEFLRTVMAGTLASELSHQSRDAEEAFLGALFRNLGRLLVAFYLPEDAEQIRALTTVSDEQPEPLSDAQASVKVLGVSHEQLAGHIGQSWGLPDGLLACMEFIGASPVLAFHAPFDQRMLSRALNDSLGYKLQHLFIDLADVAPLLYPDAGIRKGGLDDWVRYCGLHVQERHNASADALVTAEVALILFSQARRQGYAQLPALLSALARHKRRQHQAGW